MWRVNVYCSSLVSLTFSKVFDSRRNWNTHSSPWYMMEWVVQLLFEKWNAVFFLHVLNYIKFYQKIGKKMKNNNKSICTLNWFLYEQRLCLQDTISVHRPAFYAQRFLKFMENTVFKKIPSRKSSLPPFKGVPLEMFNDVKILFFPSFSIIWSISWRVCAFTPLHLSLGFFLKQCSCLSPIWEAFIAPKFVGLL